MLNQERVFYTSENGDEWRLAGGGEISASVQHLPNAAYIIDVKSNMKFQVSGSVLIAGDAASPALIFNGLG